MTYSVPNTLLIVRSDFEEALNMVLAVEVPAYQPHYITDKPWPSPQTKVKRNAVVALDRSW